MAKTALVLSAGGMFGAYQAGVWQAIERVVTPDLVVGASVGSLNGWAIAGGCGGDELVRRWLTLGEAARVRFRFPKRFSDGVLDSTVLNEWIRAMWDEFRPQVRYSLVTTCIPSFRPQRYEWPDLTWQHLAASCSVPVFLPQYRLAGDLTWDGGIMDPLPVWAALEMGATRIVAVNVLKQRPLFIRAAVGCLRAWSGYRPAAPGVEFVEIAPRVRLGPMRDSMKWTPELAGRWIEMGRADGTDALGKLSITPLCSANNSM